MPNTEAARTLAAIHVLPDQIAELAHTPITVVNDAIRDGESRPYVRDLAGWVVKLIRSHRDQGWKIISPRPRHDSPEALREVFARYAAEQELQHQDVVDDAPCAPLLLERLTSSSGDGRIQLWNEVLSTLKLQISRQEFQTWIQPAVLHTIESGLATIVVSNMQMKETIERRYLPLLRDLLTMHLDEAITVQVILNGAYNSRFVSPSCEQGASFTSTEQGQRTPHMPAPERPVWIHAERWETLPVMLRAALIGSTLEDGHVQASSPYVDRLLQSRYAEAVAVLIQDT